jgi:ankyrin repeat protein
LDQIAFVNWDWDGFPENKQSLEYLIQNGDLDEVKQRLEKMMDIDAPVTSDKQTALHLAVRYNKIDIVNYLIENEANVNCVTSNHWTPLHFACALVRYEIIKILLELYVNVESKTKSGALPLHFLVYQNVPSEHLNLLHRLSKDGALINALTSNKETPLHASCCSPYNTKRVVQTLLKSGADVNLVTK